MEEYGQESVQLGFWYYWTARLTSDEDEQVELFERSR